jgi:soluble lytic murein transglycosylase-like protein
MVKILIWAFAIITLSACSHTPYVNQNPVVSENIDLTTAVGQKLAKLDKIVPNKPASLKTDVSLSSKNSETQKFTPKLELESDELIEAKRKWNERHIAVEREREQRKKAEKRKLEIARKKAEKRKQILARKKAESKRKQILARNTDEQRKQLLARNKDERKRKQILARKKAERKRKQILARKKAEKRKQILARKKAKKRKQTLARKKAKKRKLTLARKKRRLRKKKYKIAQSRASKYYKINGLYGKQISRAARRTGVDPRLLRSVIKAESNFNSRARSSAGAVGLMQLMPATARRFGVKNRRHAGSNIMGGARYLRYLLKRYRGNKRLAMAAYNAGEGRVRRGGKVPSYTKRYVNKVLRGYHGSSKKRRSKKRRISRRKRRNR